MSTNRINDFLQGQGYAAFGAVNPGAGDAFEEVPVFEPMPWMQISKDVAWGINDRTVSFVNPTVNVETQDRIGFDVPSVAYAITAAVQNTAGAANPAVGFETARDQFRVQFVISGVNRTFQTAPVLGSSVCGTAEWPRKLGRPCWRFASGSTLLVKIVPLVANLRVDINVWVVEQTVGSNIVKVG